MAEYRMDVAYLASVILMEGYTAKTFREFRVPLPAVGAENREQGLGVVTLMALFLGVDDFRCHDGF